MILYTIFICTVFLSKCKASEAPGIQAALGHLQHDPAHEPLSYTAQYQNFHQMRFQNYFALIYMSSKLPGTRVLLVI